MKLDPLISGHEKLKGKGYTHLNLQKLQKSDGVRNLLAFLDDPKVGEEKAHHFIEVAEAHGLKTTRAALAQPEIKEPIDTAHAAMIINEKGVRSLRRILDHEAVSPKNQERALYYYRHNGFRVDPTIKALRSNGHMP